MFVKMRQTANITEYWDIWNQKVVSVENGVEPDFEVLEDPDEAYKYTRHHQLTKYKNKIDSAKSYQDFIASTTN